MIYLKSALVGIVAALTASVIWVLTMFVLPIAVPFLISRVVGSGGSAGASISSDSIMVAALVGFMAGFYWDFRSGKKSQRRA